MNQKDIDIYEGMIDDTVTTCEGETGVSQLEDLVECMGYKGDNFKYGSPIETFLIDNPGAIEAITEFIRDTPITDWYENMKKKLRQ